MGSPKLKEVKLWQTVITMVKVHLVLAPIVQAKENKGENKDQQRAPIRIGVLKILKIQKIKSIGKKGRQTNCSKLSRMAQRNG